MSHIYAWQVVTLLLLGAVLIYFRRGPTPAAKARGPAVAKQEAKGKQTSEEVYLDLRRQAIETNPKRLGMAGQLKAEEPYGVLMEMGSSASVVTLACFADGDARILYRTGGGMIGGVSHESVRKASKELVALARRVLPRMTRTTSHPLPGPDRVRFYALTLRGVFTIEMSRQALGERQSDLSSLFQSGQEVVGQMRQVEEQRSHDAT